MKSTRNAIKIIDRMMGDDVPLREMIADESVNVAVAQLIHDARTEAGYSQRELADLIGTKQPVIARLENADYEGHSLSMLNRIARALKRNLRIGLNGASQDVALEVIVEEGNTRRHRQQLQRLLVETKGDVRVASAYITDRELLCGVTDREVRVLTGLARMDIISGATSLGSIQSIIDSGAECRFVSRGPRLHAKVYLFGEEAALVTSANLTCGAFDSNIEAGVRLKGDAVLELVHWFDRLWSKAVRIDVPSLAVWKQETAMLRKEFSELRKKAARLAAIPSDAAPAANTNPIAQLHELFKKADRYFLCNTNRRYGGRVLEQRMHDRGYAAVWESFDFPVHMRKVRKGDAILMYANGAGIIGVGIAESDRPEILKAGSKDRIRKSTDKYGDRVEWRIPVKWLVWVDDDTKACNFDMRTRSFQEITDHVSRLEKVKAHFLN